MSLFLIYLIYLADIYALQISLPQWYKLPPRSPALVLTLGHPEALPAAGATNLGGLITDITVQSVELDMNCFSSFLELCVLGICSNNSITLGELNKYQTS